MAITKPQFKITNPIRSQNRLKKPNKNRLKKPNKSPKIIANKNHIFP